MREFKIIPFIFMPLLYIEFIYMYGEKLLFEKKGVQA